MAGSGVDTFLAFQGDGSDTYDGRTGIDTYSLAGTTAGATVNLANAIASSTQTGSDTLISIENPIGGAGVDTMTGASVANIFTGGLGADTLVFRSIADAGTGLGRDQIVDFTDGTDRIDLSLIDANAGAGGNQAFQFSGDGTTFTGPAQLRVHFETIGSVEHTIIEGNVNANATPVFQLDLTGRIQLTAGDFIL